MLKYDASLYIAGHAGLIGSAVVRRLERDGYRPPITRRRSELDLQNAGQVSEFFEKVRPEYVILAAGRVGGIMENQTFPADFMDDNMAIQLNVLKAARKVGVRRLILFGSSCMYPRECSQPIRSCRANLNPRAYRMRFPSSQGRIYVWPITNKTTRPASFQ